MSAPLNETRAPARRPGVTGGTGAVNGRVLHRITATVGQLLGEQPPPRWAGYPPAPPAVDALEPHPEPLLALLHLLELPEVALDSRIDIVLMSASQNKSLTSGRRHPEPRGEGKFRRRDAAAVTGAVTAGGRTHAGRDSSRRNVHHRGEGRFSGEDTANIRV
ncbi:hypothetical protein EYF80_056827 [Liparis tanakae]|uniref:Uncharacterized protein n=1 Tax=Liparis tanakae TaxID=230148 RepID=A0A4Z2EVT9_9TELE|nr:hypothetical protein EYF80_056827 [Liparis tanakae]